MKNETIEGYTVREYLDADEMTELEIAYDIVNSCLYTSRLENAIMFKVIAALIITNTATIIIAMLLFGDFI